MDTREYSLHDDAPANIYVHRGFVLDQHCTGVVRNLPVPTRGYFALENAHLFREQFQRRQRTGKEMRILVERRGSDTPAEVRVKCVDGSVLVLKDALDITPQEGACVQLLLGYKRKFIDQKTAEKWEKDDIRWI